MSPFTTIIQQFQENGEKTGWTYIDIPVDITNELQPGSRKSFRVKGSIDDHTFSGISLVPVGGGRYIMPLNASVRKAIGKRKGAMLNVRLETDNTPYEIPADIKECFDDEPEAKSFFDQLPKGHQRYFIQWIGSAKTDPTRTKRTAQAITALSKGQGFNEMIKSNKRDT